MKKVALAFLAAGFFTSCNTKKTELHVFCWGDYLADDVVESFAKENKCSVVVETFPNNDDAFAKLKAGGKGYDIVFISDDFVQMFVANGLLEKVDPSKLSNMKNLSPKHLGQAFDPKNEYTIPYFWGTTGIAFNKDQVNPPPKSWKDLWNDKYKNRVSLVDDPREAFGAALRADGKSINETSLEALAKAKERLLEHKKYALNPQSEPKTKLAQGDIWICQCFSGDAIQARQTPNAPAIDYIVPVEGGSIWIDSMALVKGAPHADLAHAFINYVLRPDIAAKLANLNGYTSPNQAALEFVNKEILSDPIANPPEDVVKRCEHLKPLSADDKKRIEDLWTEVKAK